MTNRTQSDLIASLSADLAPVRPLRAATGWALVVCAAIASGAIAVLTMGLSPAFVSGHPASHLVIANGLLLVLGLSAAAAVVAMASPAVGPRHDGPKWALGMVAILPLAAVLLMIASADFDVLAHPVAGLDCALMGTLFGSLTAAALVMWLRRGAPVSLTRAGFYVGVAAGALGSVGYGLSCPWDSFEHIGIWHVMPVAICAGLGAAIVPRLVRW